MNRNPGLRHMVRTQLAGRDIRSRRVLAAFLRVDRRHFVPERLSSQAYGDHPVAIGSGQTISQPYMVASMLQVLDVHRGMKVLEVGAGSGYVLGLLEAMGARAWGIEWHPDLASAIGANLRAAGLEGGRLRVGDGGLGWPEEAPFHRILVSAACPAVPPPLIQQLAQGGILVAPVDSGRVQVLMRYTKIPAGVREESFEGCVFVPLVGRYGKTG